MISTRLALLVTTIPLALACSSCSSGPAVIDSGAGPDRSAEFSLPRVAAQRLEPLIEIYGTTDLYLPIVDLTYLEEPIPAEHLPDDLWGDCDPTVVDAPPELGDYIDVTPPAASVWLVYEGGACSAPLGSPVLLIGQSQFLCEVIFAFPVGAVASDCGGGAARGEQSPYAVIAAEVAPSLHWVTATEPDVELAADGTSSARLSYRGVRTEVTPEAEWDEEYHEEWMTRVLAPDNHLSVIAHLLRVETPLEAAELRSVSWFFMAGGSDPMTADCSCDDWETGEPMPDCIDDHYEVIETSLGLVWDGRFLAIDERQDYPRGALVENDRIGVLVTGYLSSVAAHRRSDELVIDIGEFQSPLPTHEEDSELPPVMQQPYCGP